MTRPVHRSSSAPAASAAPDGQLYSVPTDAESEAAFAAVRKAALRHKSRGGCIVAVQGLGFVGAAVAAALATATDDLGRPLHFVVGVDLPRPETYWKVARVNAGLAPVESPDPELPRLIHEGVFTNANLVATTCEEVYALADVIVVDVHLDVVTRVVESARDIDVEMASFEAALRAVGSRMRADALVLIETTVPIGTCERIALPILTEERARRGIAEPVLLAHAYERVMPGPAHIRSIRSFPRTFAGVNAEASARARDFLATFVDTSTNRLWELEDTVSSELGKLLENAYRSLNIAFAHEWTLLAERIGVNLFEIVDSIRIRKGTHDNMRYPGFGVGGYCLTKDAYLAQWAASSLFGDETVLELTLQAMKTNHAMPLHTVDLVRELASGSLDGATIALCGISYLPDLADTRNTPAETFVDELTGAGANVRVHDPHVVRWPERPSVALSNDLRTTLAGADGVVFAVPHRAYLELSPLTLLDGLGTDAFVVDAQNILTDEKAQALHRSGCRLLGVGKGHWRKQGFQLRAAA